MLAATFGRVLACSYCALDRLQFFLDDAEAAAAAVAATAEAASVGLQAAAVSVDNRLFDPFTHPIFEGEAAQVAMKVKAMMAAADAADAAGRCRVSGPACRSRWR